MHKLVRVDRPQADAVLRKHSERVEEAVFAQEHRVVLFINNETGRPHFATRWSRGNLSPNPTAHFVRPQIVEKVPEAVTISATNKVNDQKYLFIFGYKHNHHVGGLSDEEFESWKRDGFWNRYIQENGDPIAEKRSNWSERDRREYLIWTESTQQKLARTK